MEGKVVWITGASSGIGEALAYAYHELGASLILSSRNLQQLERVQKNCVKNYPVTILTIDLELHHELPERTAEAYQIFGKIDLLINSGGISQRSLALETLASTEQRIMNTNFWGTVILSKSLIPLVMHQPGAQIACISSLVGKFGTPLRSAYSASKHALHGYFDSLRAELPEHIQITMICPGFIKTQVTINAVTGDGSRQGTMDQAQENGMLPELCAKKIVSALSAKKQEVYIGGKEIYGVWLKRFFPLLFSRVIRKAKVT